MLAIPVDRDSSAAPGVWEAGGVGFFLRGDVEFFLPGAFGLFFGRDVKNAVMMALREIK